jgi:hypothetical protein
MRDTAVPQHSIVIPLRFNHRRFALTLVAAIRSWHAQPYEIIVSASELPPERNEEFHQQLLDSSGVGSPQVKLLSTPEPATAGTNRNLGWAHVESPWTLFIDADDIYRPERSRMLLDLCTRTTVQAAVHSFAYLESPRRFLQGPLRRGPGDDIGTPDIQRHGEARPETTSRQIPDRRGSSNLALPPNGPRAIHHGHLTIKTELRHRFSFQDIPYGEDGLLAKELVSSSVPILATPWILSLYDPWRWRLPPPELLRNLKRKGAHGFRQ